MRFAGAGIPTRLSSSTARARACFLVTGSCARIISATCHPTRYCGCRLDSGSWKIIPISAPRMCRSSASVAESRSTPSNRALPETRAPLVSPTIVWVDTLLPDPDSPTMPSVWPASTVKLTPRTARSTPSCVAKLTCRSSTSSSAISGLPARSGPDNGEPSSSVAQPHVRDVVVLVDRQVHRVLQLRGLVQRDGDRGQRDERRVLHALHRRLVPQRADLGGGSGWLPQRLLDQAVRDRAVVVAVVDRVGAVLRPVGHRLEHRPPVDPEPVRHPEQQRDVPQAALAGRRVGDVVDREVGLGGGD